ncbi:MAG: phosphoglucosamine mutase [Lachnospiraceae bacterium]|nr:phosphoglucosamine mutase [Lachnospiraceae bacterium]
MKLKYFGTDGFRGKVNKDLKVEHALKIGQFLGWYFSEKKGRAACCVIGKDTRMSSYMYEYAISAGVTSVGGDAYLMHVTTSPSVSYITKVDRFDFGVMITASHNPYHDNGIKVFDADGNKLAEDILYQVEQYIDGEIAIPNIEEVGVCKDYIAGRNKYMGYLSSIPTESFRGYKIGLDCANGAAHSIAKNVFQMLGADVYAISDRPDGKNINVDCGSTHIGNLQKLVRAEQLDIGFAFDGDADRCLMVNEKGEVVDGDGIMYILANYFKDRGMLRNNPIAVTVMSNLGLKNALSGKEIGAVITDVGDKYIAQALDEKKLAIGGEQSGHIIVKKYANTGDGILTALLIAEILVSSKCLASAMVGDLKILPQKLVNIRSDKKDEIMEDPETIAFAEKVNEEMAGRGRLLLRKSGTEPLIRIMVEAPTDEEIDEVIEKTKVFLEGRKN